MIYCINLRREEKVLNTKEYIVEHSFKKIIILLFCIIILLDTSIVNKGTLNIFLFGLILFFSWIMLSKTTSNVPYSLTMMHWFFVLFFYGIAGFKQYLANRYVYSPDVSEKIISYTVFLIIIWMIFYYLGSKVSKYKSTNNNAYGIQKLLIKKLKLNYSFVVIFTIISVILTIIILTKLGFKSVLSRSFANNAYIQLEVIESTAGTTLLLAFLRNLTLYSFSIAIIYYKVYKRGLILVLIQSICCFLINSPFSSGRFHVAIVYLGILLLIIPIFKKRGIFISIFFIGLVIIFPVLSIFRYTPLNEVGYSTIVKSLRGISDSFIGGAIGGDYDAFSMIINTKNYIDLYDITWGYQLLASILFFIPRSMWPMKPFGSGYTIRISQGYEFANVSSPLIAEGLINFGFIGVVLFAFIFGFITSYIDKLYWSRAKKNDSNVTYIEILYPFLLSAFFFMNRGDLMSTFSFCASHIIIYSLLFWINNYIYKITKKNNIF